MALRRSLLLAISLGCLPSLCQIGSGGGVGVASISTSSISTSGFNNRAGLPFSAEIVTTTVQTLADGTQITTHQGKQLMARDAAGRTRTEIYLPDLPPGIHRDSDQPIFVTIVDPVAGQMIHLNPRQKTATVTPRPTVHPGQDDSIRKTQPTVPVQSLPHQEGTHSSVEKLDGKSIDGVYAEGSRITRVIPAGSQGNDRDFSVITETWESPELGIQVLNKTTDPRNGVTTRETKNLTRTEPDPALFQVPADYELQTPQHP
jgi:hypothetical protein